MKYLSILFLFFCSCMCLAEASPSFNCNKASTAVEIAICNSVEISKLDSEMASLYNKFIRTLPKNNASVAKKMQRLWLGGRGVCANNNDLSKCIKSNYSEWLNAMRKGVLLSATPVLEGKVIKNPFNKNTFFKLKITQKNQRLSDDEHNELYALYFIEGDSSKILHEGYSNYQYVECDGDGNDENKIISILFYLHKNGTKHIALKQSVIEYDGWCKKFNSKSLLFLSIKDNYNNLKIIKLSSDQKDSGAYYNDLFRWDISINGGLLFYKLESNQTSYYQQVFTEVLAIYINSEQGEYKSYYWVDPSGEEYLDVKYEKIIESVEKGIWGIDNSSGKDSCVIPGNGLSDYWRLKEILSQYKLGFNQIEFYSKNFLVPGKLKLALKYRPLIESALLYLNKAKSISGWKEKLRKSAQRYPQFSFYGGNNESVGWDVNPFIEAGFYTDNGCYSMQPSPWRHASMEEWYYLFWARRIVDGNLERAEIFLTLVMNMMNVAQLSANKPIKPTLETSSY